MGKIITFGEIMLRLMPEDGHRLLRNDRLEATFGGGLIYALHHGMGGQDAIEFAIAAEALHSGRLQPCHRQRGRESDAWQRLRPCPALIRRKADSGKGSKAWKTY